MNKNFVKFSFLGISLLILLGIGYYYAKSYPILTIRSPNNEYQLVAWEDPISSLLLSTQIKFKTLKDNEAFIDASYLTAYDSFEEFKSKYSSQKWLDDHCLIFNSRNTHNNLPLRIIIENRSGKPLKYFRLQGEDIFLFLDIVPDQKISVSTLRQDLFGSSAQFHDDSIIIGSEISLMSDDAGSVGCVAVRIEQNNIEISDSDPPLCEKEN